MVILVTVGYVGYFLGTLEYFWLHFGTLGYFLVLLGTLCTFLYSLVILDFLRTWELGGLEMAGMSGHGWKWQDSV